MSADLRHTDFASSRQALEDEKSSQRFSLIEYTQTLPPAGRLFEDENVPADAWRVAYRQTPQNLFLKTVVLL